MLLLNGGGLATLERCRERHGPNGKHLGALARPRHVARLGAMLERGFRVGVDNDAFSSWSLERFVAMVGRIEQVTCGRPLTFAERIGVDLAKGWGRTAGGPPVASSHPNLLFVTVPDVPFDARATARRWADWAPLMSHFPLALCVQDGAGDVGIPWGWPGLRCLFMAGSTEYKLSTEMSDICREGKRRGLHIHAGRVNTRKRIRYLLSLGDVVDSIDGTAFDRWRNAHLSWGLQEVSADTYQLGLPW